jgi:hypothetical protein
LGTLRLEAVAGVAPALKFLIAGARRAGDAAAGMHAFLNSVS